MIQIKDQHVSDIDKVLGTLREILKNAVDHPLAGHFVKNPASLKAALQAAAECQINISDARRGYPNAASAGGGL